MRLRWESLNFCDVASIITFINCFNAEQLFPGITLIPVPQIYVAVGLFEESTGVCLNVCSVLIICRKSHSQPLGISSSFLDQPMRTGVQQVLCGCCRQWKFWVQAFCFHTRLFSWNSVNNMLLGECIETRKHSETRNQPSIVNHWIWNKRASDCEVKRVALKAAVWLLSGFLEEI